jgi:DNA helicase II / ATP-dependent DNA helicase PcrA
MINRTEADERAHLEIVKRKLSRVLARLEGRVSRYAQDVRAQKQHIWEHKGDMDHAEKSSARESAEQTMRSGEVALAAKRRLQKLVQSPYFGRFDFQREGSTNGLLPVYVGTRTPSSVTRTPRR